MTIRTRARLSLRTVRTVGVVFLLSLSGCLYDEVSIDFANGVNVYNFLSKEHPVQTIAFENGVPPALRDVLIDGLPVSLYKRSMRGGIPVRRDEEGKILALSYHWSERHTIKFTHETTQYTMPLSEKQLRRIFGPPKNVDRRTRHS